MTNIEMYRCDICGKVYANNLEALDCEVACSQKIKDNAMFFFEKGERVNLADFIAGNSPDYIYLRAIKIADAETAERVQGLLSDAECIPFPTLTNDNTTQWPVTMITSSFEWDWKELDEAIGFEEERHAAAMKEMESWR